MIGKLYHDFVTGIEVFHLELKRRAKMSFDAAAMRDIEGATDWRAHARRKPKGEQHAA